MIENIPPELALLFVLICIPVIVALLLVDKMENRIAQLAGENIMLQGRIKDLDEKLDAWIGQPRLFLEAGLKEPEVIKNGR